MVAFEAQALRKAGPFETRLVSTPRGRKVQDSFDNASELSGDGSRRIAVSRP
ncbi:hypothetical protein M3J09_013004 [Ascochyta lentis]